MPSDAHKFDKKFRASIYEKTGGHCYYCGTHLTPKNASVDHIVPVSKYGTDDITNLIGACVSCNKRKKNHSMESFRVLQSRLNQHIPLFSKDQIEFLEKNGFKAHVPTPELFWWEKQ